MTVSKKILVAADLSEFGIAAIKHAFGNILNDGDDLILVTVVKPTYEEVDTQNLDWVIYWYNIYNNIWLI